MESVRSARRRLQQLPRHLSACSGPSAAYARCVLLKEGASKDGVARQDCQPEFAEFRRCLVEQAKKGGSRL